ncbi:DUF2938 domain-containing protein [Photobacterium halotolerans]|uniref:Membrane protein n=1 Tax=Photobacterium halotolerans TaxID=265726 RepID=A0A0F5V9S0_9GAMM|nr:DUF2938 domain-containing protein [Photobacterium halotolerans]KKC98817.1 membrane protein [Photobacterium halotolerans]
MEPDFILRAIALGVGATLVMDLWALFLKVCFKIPSLNYAMVGRWIGHFPKGQFAHANIGQAEPVAGETLLGWTAHYAIGICFAAVLLWGWGLEWAASPTLLPALIVGVLTVVAPFFLMQPGMGAGVAASKTPQPNTARLRSLLAHTSFGVGLYLTGMILSVF